MSNFDQTVYDRQKAVIAEKRDKALGSFGPAYIILNGKAVAHAAGGTAERMQAIREMGFAESDASYLAGLDDKTRGLLLPTPDAIMIAKEMNLDLAGMVRVLATQNGILLPSDFGTAATAPTAGAYGVSRP